MSEIKKMNLTEFRKFGLLQEVNRLFFHPLGLALEFSQDDKGNDSISGIWDYREDPEGVLFADSLLTLPDFHKKMKDVAEFTLAQHTKRLKTIGFIIQKPPLENDKTSSQFD
jgi:hypothetical protein